MVNQVSVSRDGIHQSLTNGKFPFEFDWLMRILIKKHFYRSEVVSEGKDFQRRCADIIELETLRGQMMETKKCLRGPDLACTCQTLQSGLYPFELPK